MKIIQIIIKDKNTILGLGDDGRVYISKDDEVWQLYIEKTYIDSDDVIHRDEFKDEIK